MGRGGGELVHQERWAETKSIRGCQPGDGLQDLSGFCAMEMGAMGSRELGRGKTEDRSRDGRGKPQGVAREKAGGRGQPLTESLVG